MAAKGENTGGLRLLRGYGPLAAMAIAFVLMVALVPSKAPTALSAEGGGAAPIAATDVDKWVSGGDAVSYCSDVTKAQVEGDPYSPPCFTFNGENGGDTAKGVTAQEIVIAQRSIKGGDIMSTVDLLAGRPEIPQGDITRTAEGLVEYFNQNFQFYGRKMKLANYTGGSDATKELTGAAQDLALRDATKVAQELKAFADMSAGTQPYSTALATQKVIAIGAPYMSDKYFNTRRPYAWSHNPSCTLVSKASVEITIKMIAGKPAKFAEGDLKDKPRKIALLHPDNEEYTNCAEEALKTLREANVDITAFKYELDIAKLASEGKRLAAELKSGGFTTVACACDPAMPMFMLPEATNLSFKPEWNVMGVALTDTDFAGQLYDDKAPGQWNRAYGATALGMPMDYKETDAYKAFKSVRPGEEPTKNVESLYRQLYMIAIGVHMAGPELTPENFEKGMFAYSEHVGSAGGWKWAPGKYTPQTTADILWWDPDAPSPSNGELGSYQRMPGGPYKFGQVPTKEPEVFR